MTKQRSRRAFLATAGTAAALGLAGCSSSGNTSSDPTTNTTATSATTSNSTTETTATTAANSGSVEVFHAGSLTAAFDDLKAGFTSKYDASVSEESAGSVTSTKKITQPPHRAADVLAVADFRLLRDDLLPKYGDWYAIFATNAMTLIYTKDSKDADQFTPDNWWNVLAKSDVAVGHSDPAVDPNGYRALMSMQLGAMDFQGSALYDSSTAKAMKQNATVPASNEVDLVSQVQSGKLDYAWEYQSAGATHDVQTIDLQPAVDLSKVSSAYADHYAKASVTAGGKTYTGAPIAYGVTVPSTANHPAWGAKWVEYMLGDGASIVSKDGFNALDTAVVPKSDASNVPDGVMATASAKASLGPMNL